MTQALHPETIMVNAWKAFITCYIATPERATELHDHSDMEPRAGSEAMPPHYMPTTFSRAHIQAAAASLHAQHS